MDDTSDETMNSTQVFEDIASITMSRPAGGSWSVIVAQLAEGRRLQVTYLRRHRALLYCLFAAFIASTFMVGVETAGIYAKGGFVEFRQDIQPPKAPFGCHRFRPFLAGIDPRPFKILKQTPPGIIPSLNRTRPKYILRFSFSSMPIVWCSTNFTRSETIEAGFYVSQTYEHVYQKVPRIVNPGAHCGIYGFNCPERVMAKEICNSQGICYFPLYDTLGANAFEFMTDLAEISIAFFRESKIKSTLAVVPKCAAHLKVIHSFEGFASEMKTEAQKLDVSCFGWEEFPSIGKHDYKLPNKCREDICTIMNTSGTTRDPKGVIITNRAIFYYGLEFGAFSCKAVDKWDRGFGQPVPFYSVFHTATDADHQLFLQTSRMNMLLLVLLVASLAILILVLSNNWKKRKNKNSPWQVALTRRNHFRLIPYAARYFRRIMRSCLELPKSNQIAEKNTTSERGALSKDKEDAMKPLGSVEVEHQIFMILMGLRMASVTFQAALSTQYAFLSDFQGDGEHLLVVEFLCFNCIVFMISLIKLLVLAAAAMACHGQSICSRILGSCSSAALIGLTDAFTIWSSRSLTASIYFSALVVAVLLWKPLHQVVAFLLKPLENWNCNSQETLEKCSKHWDTAESEDHRHPALLSDDPEEAADADQRLHKSRMYLLLLGILAATTTYLAGLEPPSGLWQENATDGAHHYRAGATSFVPSLVILILLLSDTCSTGGIKYCAFQVTMILDLLGLIRGAYAAGSCRESADPATHKEDPNRPINGNNPCDHATWRVACAAPHHMTGDQSLLLTGSYMPMHDGNDDGGEGVFVPAAGNGEVVPLRARGSGSVRTESIALDDVWYVPGLDSNLVSTGQLARQGCAVSLGPGGCRITRGGAMVGMARFTEQCQFELDFLKVADVSSM